MTSTLAEFANYTAPAAFGPTFHHVANDSQPTNTQATTWSTDFVLDNPLIVILGIGEYDKDVFPTLIGVRKDYINIIYGLAQHQRYDCMYFNGDNELVVLDKKSSVEDWDMEFKLRWSCDEIDSFIEEISDLIWLHKVQWINFFYFKSWWNG